MSMSIVHVHVHIHGACLCPGACTCTWCMSMSMVHVHVHGACPCPWFMYMSMVHVHVNGACPCPWCMSMSMVHDNVHGACPCPKCITIVHAGCLCPCNMSMSMLHFGRPGGLYDSQASNRGGARREGREFSHRVFLSSISALGVMKYVILSRMVTPVYVAARIRLKAWEKLESKSPHFGHQNQTLNPFRTTSFKVRCGQKAVEKC
jgi:hypothetical protein